MNIIKRLIGKFSDKYLIKEIKNNISSDKIIIDYLLESSYRGDYFGFWDWKIDFTINPEDNYEYMSPIFWEMLGYDPSTKKHVAGEWMKLMYNEDRESAFEKIKKHIKSKGKTKYRQYVRYLHKNGQCIYVLCEGKVIEWNGDIPLRMVGTHINISSNKLSS
tara:strand:+ start:30353 stop:30838 length:486 start_codon:yes stop_codon:yes gene_type:complete